MIPRRAERAGDQGWESGGSRAHWECESVRSDSDAYGGRESAKGRLLFLRAPRFLPAVAGRRGRRRVLSRGRRMMLFSPPPH